MAEATPADRSAPLAGRRILVVEDEVLVSMLLEDMLSDLGCEVVGPAAKLAKGSELAETAEIDGAVLDLNLAGQDASPIADVLARRNIPFIFASGYGAAGVPERFRDRPTLPKPFRQQDLEELLTKLLGAA